MAQGEAPRWIDSLENAPVACGTLICAGRGKIFLTRVDEAIRIRNDDRGDAAL